MSVEHIGNSLPAALLQVDRLSVVLRNGAANTSIISDITFSVLTNECLIFIGESGSGKSTLARALTSLFPPTRGVGISGSVMLDGKDLLADTSSRAGVRYVLQEPGLALNPALKIGAQLKLLSDSKNVDGISARLRAQAIADPERVFSCYPHEISAGMAQRILLAAALNARPRLLICDEPTSAVDLESRELILGMLRDYYADPRNALIVVTHDLVFARRLATNIAVLYNGRIVEMAQAEAFYSHPMHPYSQALLSMVPAADSVLESLPVLPSAGRSAREQGCAYAANCARVQPDCRSRAPALEPVAEGRRVRCPYWK